jgi:hypothetical protein
LLATLGEGGERSPHHAFGRGWEHDRAERLRESDGPHASGEDDDEAAREHDRALGQCGLADLRGKLESACRDGFLLCQ